MMANADSSVRLFQQHESESVDTALPVCIPCSVVVQKGWRCSQGLFASSIILNGSCCLVLVTIWKSRHSSTAMVSYLSIPGSQMCPLGYCFVFTKPWCPSCAIRTALNWSDEGIKKVIPFSMIPSDVWVLWSCACMVPRLAGLA